MAASTLILYDLPSKDRCTTWSFNPWKTRLALNYKNIPYTTEWLEYPDIAPHHRSVGIPPSNEGAAAYTIPAVKFPDGTYMQNSRTIATKLESIYPEPSLHLDSPILARLEALASKITVLGPVFMPRIPPNILPPRSAEYFRETRQKRFGMPLEELERTKSDAAWQQAEPLFKEMAALLKENDNGPFFMGSEVSYSDFIVVGFLQCFKRTGQDIFDRIVGIDQAFADLYEASQAWLKRDDH